MEIIKMTTPPAGAEKKLAAGLCGILLGGMGIHKFILGYSTEGIIMLLVTILGVTFSCFLIPLAGPLIMWTIGLVEGIIYLTKTDEDFVNTYIVNKKTWF
jgi:TM2 domain-containing membrane protein YozV